MKTNVSVRVVNPKELSSADFERLNEVSQDMWAQSIWELVQCKSCQKMMSKQDIFWHLEKEIYDETVKKILQILEISEISCIECSGKTRFIYPDEHVENIKERLLQSEESFLVVCENSTWEIVWYEEWYIDTFDTIFRRELAYHYEKIWKEDIKTKIQDILWYCPEEMFILSSIGFLNQYVNFITLFEIFKHFAINIPDSYLYTLWITEVDKRNSLDMVTNVMWGISLWFQEEERYKKQIINIGNGYQSNLKIIPNLWENYKKYLSKGAKYFLKIAKNNS